MWVPKILLTPKKGFLAHKRPKLAFWPNIGIFGPFGPMANQKMMQTRCLGSFSVTWVPKLLLPPVRLGLFAQKGQIWSKICIFGLFGPNIGIFGPFCPMSDQKTMQVPGCFFRYMGTKTFDFSCKNKVNRCLARYSPRAIPANQPTNRAPNEPARPGRNEQKCQFQAKFDCFGAKSPNFCWRNQTFCYPHSGKPT